MSRSSRWRPARWRFRLGDDDRATPARAGTAGTSECPRGSEIFIFWLLAPRWQDECRPGERAMIRRVSKGGPSGRGSARSSLDHTPRQRETSPNGLLEAVSKRLARVDGRGEV